MSDQPEQGLESEFDIFKRKLVEYLDIMAEKNLQPDGEAALAYLESEVEREIIIRRLGYK